MYKKDVVPQTLRALCYEIDGFDDVNISQDTYSTLVLAEDGYNWPVHEIIGINTTTVKITVEQTGLG